MSDDADIAATIVEETIVRGLLSIAADIPAGVPGECEDCGEAMPRLVGGRCGFCRDGRRPPLSHFETLPVPREEKPAVKKPSIVPHRVGRTRPAPGVTTEQAPVTMPEEASVPMASPEVAPAAAPAPLAIGSVAMVDLSVVPFEWLTEEIARRVSGASAAQDRAFVAEDKLMAATERAAAAEKRLAEIRKLVGFAAADPVGERA